MDTDLANSDDLMPIVKDMIWLQEAARREVCRTKGVPDKV